MESFHVYLCIYEFNALFAYLNLCLKRKKLPSEGVFMPQHLRFSCTAHSSYTTSKKKTYLLHGEFGYPPVFVWTLYVCYQNRAKPRPRALMDLLEHTELSHHLKHHVMIYQRFRNCGYYFDIDFIFGSIHLSVFCICDTYRTSQKYVVYITSCYSNSLSDIDNRPCSI